MELDINDFVEEWDGAWMDFSASAAELGPDAARITWNAAKEAAEESPILVTMDQLNAARDYFADFGAWDSEELDAMSPVEVNALLIQFIAGAFRESEHYDSFEEYSEAAGGNLYPGDDGRWYFYLGM